MRELPNGWRYCTPEEEAEGCKVDPYFHAEDEDSDEE